ncbi:hypothetical protein ACIBK9_31435 [Nonomuraea sp. NPDC050227]|uniref:hypothetical protein n=1 Tax=Nonomuraea sp. NPDC050227 TaxID=3364360 RepID=UPI0037AC200D
MPDGSAPAVFGELAEVVGGQWELFPSLPGMRLRAAARQAIGVPALTAADVRVERTWTDGDLHGEELSWTVGFGPRTRAYLLRPRDHDGPLPGPPRLRRARPRRADLGQPPLRAAHLDVPPAGPVAAGRLARPGGRPRPRPLMVQYALRDDLFPQAGMRRAHARIGERYRDAPGRYEAVFAPSPHCFDVPMQERAFDWLARELVSRPPSTGR